MGKYLFAIACVVALLFPAFAIALTLGRSQHSKGSLKNGSTSFTMKVLHPKKIILYPESQDVKTSYSILCVKGEIATRVARSFTTPYTRNLLYMIPPRQNVCYLAVAGATNKNVGQIVVQTQN